MYAHVVAKSKGRPRPSALTLQSLEGICLCRFALCRLQLNTPQNATNDRVFMCVWVLVAFAFIKTQQ